VVESAFSVVVSFEMGQLQLPCFFHQRHNGLMNAIRVTTYARALAAPLAVTLADPWDQMFIEVTFASQADYLVTRNLKQSPETSRAGVSVVSPRAFLDLLLEGQ
jgi:predicted nucleic acid-binding protein